MANPDLAAYMPAYKAPIPQAVVDCLEQNPTGTGCPYADYSQYFENPHGGGDRNRECFWPEVCQENARWARPAPRKFRQPEDINEPLGRRRADQLAHLLGMDAGMILTELDYHCVRGIPPRPPDRETIFRCIYNLTNSNGNAAVPLSSYGLNVTEQGDVRSICAPGSPCLEFNALFGGRLEEISQSMDAWRSFCAWWLKRRFFSSSKMRIPARRAANPHASSKPPARETDTREKAAPTRKELTARALRRLPARVNKRVSCCSHGPVGRFPHVKNTARSKPATGRWLQHLRRYNRCR